MEDLETRFSAACDFVADSVTSGSAAFNDDKLKLKFYGYFKQASDGKCNTAKPGILSFAARSKWWVCWYNLIKKPFHAVLAKNISGGSISMFRSSGLISSA